MLTTVNRKAPCPFGSLRGRKLMLNILKINPKHLFLFFVPKTPNDFFRLHLQLFYVGARDIRSFFFIQRTAKSDSNLPQGNEISLLELNLFILSFFCSLFVLITVPILKFRTRTWGFSLSVSAVYGSVLFWWSHSIGVFIKHSKFRTKPFTVFPKNHNYFPAPPCPSKETDFIVWILRHARRSFFSFLFLNFSLPEKRLNISEEFRKLYASIFNKNFPCQRNYLFRYWLKNSQ